MSLNNGQATKDRKQALDEAAAATRAAPVPAEWADPVWLDPDPFGPPFPLECLCDWLAAWVVGISRQTQTPPDLAAMLALALCGAGVARKFVVQPRARWFEPLNVYTVVSLPPGDRKSSVFREAISPVEAIQAELIRQAGPAIAVATSQRRALEASLKKAEERVSRELDENKRGQFEEEMSRLARELSEFEVPVRPKLVTDDVTQERLAGLLAQNGGRALVAAPEGTIFEICGGRYSEGANFDVFLKGHAGDSINTDRVGRDGELVSHPAVSAALAVQPTIIKGLARETSMRGKGFLARWLYSLPRSIVGQRETASEPLGSWASGIYYNRLAALWRLEGSPSASQYSPRVLAFSPEADALMQRFERWLEPQLADGEHLAALAGWANKLAGACARLAGILHLAAWAGSDEPPGLTIGAETVERTIRLGRDYLLPHAQLAFDQMQANEKMDNARKLWASVLKHRNEVVDVVYGSVTCPTISRRDLHTWNRRSFATAEDMDPAINLLIDSGYMVYTGGTVGRGNKGPTYALNPRALTINRTQRTQLDPQDEGEDGETCTQRTQPGR